MSTNDSGTNHNDRSVFIVEGSRTPFLRALKPNDFSAADLAVACGRPLLARMPFPLSAIDEVIVGCVMPSAQETNPARVIALRLGCPDSTPAWTVQRNCASGLQALDSAAQSILLGRSDIVLAGGTEAMSRAPLLYSEAYVAWLGQFSRAKSFSQKLKVMAAFKPRMLKPVIALVQGLNDATVACNMGETAGEIAHRFDITRLEMDEYALESQKRALNATSNGLFKAELQAIYDARGHAYLSDDGIRADSSLERLSKLKPAFDKPYGFITPGNSSQITDGAAMMVLASAHAVDKHKLPVLGRIVDVAWAALDPRVMGLGPVHAIAQLLQKQALSIQDIDYWEINEAFAGQVIGCVRALDDKKYCQEVLGLDAALGRIPDARLNVDGGAISLGHPVGASGARVVLHLLQVLKRTKSRYGIASLCIGGGQGGAVLIENMSEDAS